MQSFRDKVTDKLTHLFSDSPNPDQAQARSYPKDDKSFPSIPPQVSRPPTFDVFGLNKHQTDFRRIPSQLTKASESFAEYDSQYENKELPISNNEQGNHGSTRGATLVKNKMSQNQEENDNFGSGQNICGYEMHGDATGRHSSEKFMPDPTDNSLFISLNLYDFFQSCLPNIVKGCQWVLLYSTVRDGTSLRTLIRKSVGFSGPCLLITGDMRGTVFGGLLECPLKPTAQRKYQGTNQSFVFTTIYGEPRLFRPTGANRYFYMCLNEFLAMGGGGNFALRLDGDLLNGTSGPCDTFGNLCLAHSQDFKLKNVELWGFVHASKYLS